MTDQTTEETIELHPGDLVEHSAFGLGKVLDIQTTNVLVHFRDDNQDVRKLSFEKAPLSLCADQSDPLLDGLLRFNDGKFESRV
jgi:transcription elongation factor GreA-like protein